MAPWTIWFKTADADHWQPLEPFRSLPTGHYRLAVRLPVACKRLQWRWKFFPTSGRVQNHDFQGCTNQEGLISLLDLHTVQAGTWQLTAQPDLFDHLCGETWRIQFQFQIIAQMAQVAPPHPVVTVPKLESDKEAEDIAENNAIVPHPPQTAVPEAAIKQSSVTEWEKTEAVPRPDQKSPSRISPFRTVNYALELIYPELENPIQVDITVMLDDSRKPTKLDLPDPRRMVGSLYRQSRSAKSPLPPKLPRLRWKDRLFLFFRGKLN